jgi:hypothetical protein
MHNSLAMLHEFILYVYPDSYLRIEISVQTKAKKWVQCFIFQ